MGMTDFDKLSEIRWQPKSWQWVDPLKDIKASVEAINAGIKTASEVVAEQGGDIEDVYEQLAYEQQLAKDKGLNLSVNNEVTANETNQNG
jgi:capsid protein